MPPNAGSDPLAGTPYRCLSRLGAGGMGEVFEAEQVVLGKRVVVKLIHPQFASNPGLVDRLRLEAEVLARLTHPNLVAVLDCGLTGGGRPYVVLERLYGRTLRDELREHGRIPVAAGVGWTRQILAGLEAAHAAGIVHRDIKLDNVFVCDPAVGTDGARTVKVLDFGIAKIVGDPSGRGPSPLAYQTEEGIAVGTPRFFSPEQAQGGRVDARTDLYATGVVLYTLLAGRGPFDHWSDTIDLAKAHVGERPEPPSRHVPELPRGLDGIVLRALEKDPGDRFQSARAFGQALREALGDADTPTPAWSRTEIMPTTKPASASAAKAPADADAVATVPAAPRLAAAEPIRREPSSVFVAVVTALVAIVCAGLAIWGVRWILG